MEALIRFTKVREVISPTRAHKGDAGIDFYIPTDLTYSDILEANKSAKYMTINHIGFAGIGIIGVDINNQGFISTITLGPHTRILIPSGIKVLIEPINSMLMAANKSGVSTRDGLIYTAEIVDSPYTGEVHIGIVNTTDYNCTINVDKKVIQFIHVPIYDTEPKEISHSAYDLLSENWGTRGSDGFGSTDAYVTLPDND